MNKMSSTNVYAETVETQGGAFKSTSHEIFRSATNTNQLQKTSTIAYIHRFSSNQQLVQKRWEGQGKTDSRWGLKGFRICYVMSVKSWKPPGRHVRYQDNINNNNNVFIVYNSRNFLELCCEAVLEVTFFIGPLFFFMMILIDVDL